MSRPPPARPRDIPPLSRRAQKTVAGHDRRGVRAPRGRRFAGDAKQPATPPNPHEALATFSRPILGASTAQPVVYRPQDVVQRLHDVLPLEHDVVRQMPDVLFLLQNVLQRIHDLVQQTSPAPQRPTTPLQAREKMQLHKRIARSAGETPRPTGESAASQTQGKSPPVDAASPTNPKMRPTSTKPLGHDAKIRPTRPKPVGPKPKT